MALSVDTTPAKHVTVLRNGDNQYEGRKFIVSRRRYRTFDSFLSDITSQLSAPFGAVRRLHTPKGRRQIRTIEEVEGGATYIASGNERFKKINYSPLSKPNSFWANVAVRSPGFLADDPPPLVLPKKNRRYAQRSAQFYKVHQPVQFTIFRNGLPQEKGIRFLLKSREMRSYETVLSIISMKVRLVEGAVRRLYSIDGQPIIQVEEITDGGVYVACGNRRYIPAVYGEVPTFTKPQKLPAIKRNKNPNNPSTRTQSNPLPAIEKKHLQSKSKAKSEKDSPVPIVEEDHDKKAVEEQVAENEEEDAADDESSIPDMTTEGDPANDDNHVALTPRKSELPDAPETSSPTNPLDVNSTNRSAIEINPSDSDTIKKPSKLSVDKVSSKHETLKKKSSVQMNGDTAGSISQTEVNKRTSKKSNINVKKSSANVNSGIQSSEILQQSVNDSSVFNATSDSQNVGDGQFLMNKLDNGERSAEKADEVDEDTGLVEEKPIDLQMAEEVEEEEIKH